MQNNAGKYCMDPPVIGLVCCDNAVNVWDGQDMPRTSVITVSVWCHTHIQYIVPCHVDNDCYDQGPMGHRSLLDTTGHYAVVTGLKTSDC